MVLNSEKLYNVINYSACSVSVSAKNTEYLFNPGSQESPYILPLMLHEIIEINSTGRAFKDGLLFFDTDTEEDMYNTLRIPEWKNILKDWEIEDIILNPTMDGIKKILNVNNEMGMQRVNAIYVMLKNSFADIPSHCAKILDARIEEYRNGVYNTKIVIKSLFTGDSSKIQELTDENDSLKSEIEKLKAKLKKVEESSTKTKSAAKKE
ncbi:MAG: hypothetical protein M0P00_10930 [Bacteroidaceae bacterium]|nr:hypothetical protein [Bacteroidaceae bacterium]